jgi:serine/threonine protein kinase
VAIKIVFPQSMRDETATKRLERDQAVARLEHPNVVTAFDSRHDRGFHYPVMRYFDGVDPAPLVKQREGHFRSIWLGSVKYRRRTAEPVPAAKQLSIAT